MKSCPISIFDTGKPVRRWWGRNALATRIRGKSIQLFIVTKLLSRGFPSSGTFVREGWRRIHGPLWVLFATVCAIGHTARAESALTAETVALPAPDAEGFITLFNGHDLRGWEGLAGYWSVKDGAITGHQTKELSKQTFLVLSALAVRNFELHFSYRFVSPEGNSGIQFRSTLLDGHTYRVGGYQADIDAERKFDGTIYDEAGVAGGRGTMSNRAERTIWDFENRRHVEPLGQTAADLLAFIKVGDWNDAILLARGNHITYSINGHIMTDLVDGSPAALQAGRLALQLHQGFTMEIQFRNLKIKLLN